jgi:hypothetical protein
MLLLLVDIVAGVQCFCENIILVPCEWHVEILLLVDIVAGVQCFCENIILVRYLLD